MRERLSENKIRRLLGEDSERFNLSVAEVTGSTNTDIKNAARAGAPNNTVRVADCQTEGRGRMGREFYSPADSGIYLSYLYKGGFETDTILRMTTAASVVACRAIERVTGTEPKIKWVNDLYLNGRKISGILAESITDPKSGRICGVVVGIGVNCTNDSFPMSISEVAGAISQGGRVPRNELAAEMIKEFENVKKIAADGSYIDEYKRRSMVIGREIRIIGTKTEDASAIDIDKNGGLVVKYNDGRIKTLSSGEISIRIK